MFFSIFAYSSKLVDIFWKGRHLNSLTSLSGHPKAGQNTQHIKQRLTSRVECTFLTYHFAQNLRPICWRCKNARRVDYCGWWCRGVLSLEIVWLKWPRSNRPQRTRNKADRCSCQCRQGPSLKYFKSIFTADAWHCIFFLQSPIVFNFGLANVSSAPWGST